MVIRNELDGVSPPGITPPGCCVPKAQMCRPAREGTAEPFRKMQDDDVPGKLSHANPVVARRKASAADRLKFADCVSVEIS
jgi:hypothetical protein